MEVLKAAEPLQPRQQVEPCPELGGAVICRGLLASEAFAVSSLRSQALRRVRQARAEHTESAGGNPEAPAVPFEPPELDFDELRAYGRYISHLLACGVVTASGIALFTAEQWEVMGQHHPGLMERLQLIVEQLSGMGDGEDVRKNSPPTPS